ncbi:hypothetical protein ABW19_dt0200020 [Dactylella cylindrospora]|nr:hypothetical protein ABW19_dt0200020 [Dactylella cylindrospora]
MSKNQQTIPSVSLLKFLSSQLVLFSLSSPLASALLVIPQQPTTQDFIPTRTSTVPPALNTVEQQSASRITAAPKIDLQKLFARQDTAANSFCAYENGDKNSPLFCPSGYSCGLIGTESAAFGCCRGTTCTNAAQFCVGGNDPTNFCDSLNCDDYFFSVLTCSGNKAACITYVLAYETYGVTITLGPHSYTCGDVAREIQVWTTPLNGVAAATTGSSNDAEETPVNNAPGSATATRGSSSSNNSDDNNGNNGNNGGKRLDVGVIIGIVVAALGVLATVMVGLFPRQMTRCLTCGLRPKKEHSNEEMRKMAWAYFRLGGGNVPPGGHGGDQTQPLYHGGAPMGVIGLQPMPGQGGQMAWNQQGWQGQPQGQWGYTGYTGAGTPPPYQQQYQPDYMPAAQYAHPHNYQRQEQRVPFLEK